MNANSFIQQKEISEKENMDLEKNDRGDGIEPEILKNATDSLIEAKKKKKPVKETVVSSKVKERGDVSSEYASEEEHQDWLKFYNQQACFFEPFPDGEAVQEFRRWEQSVRKQQLNHTLIPLMEENEDARFGDCKVKSEVNDIVETDDEELNPLLKLMLQPTIYIWENFDDQKPIKWFGEHSQKTPTGVREVAGFSNAWGVGELGETTEPLQKCTVNKENRKWFSRKSLRQNGKEKERTQGFFAKFFH